MPQDYSGQNLRGRNFRGKNLEFANFSGADIRSADFSGANLKGANFSHAKAGLQKRWATLLLLVSWFISGCSGAFSGSTALAISPIFDSSNLSNQFHGWLILIPVIFVNVFMLYKGLNSAVAVAVAYAVAVVYVGAISYTLTEAIVGAAAIVIAVAIAGPVAGTIAGVVGIAMAETIILNFASNVGINKVEEGGSAKVLTELIAGETAGVTAGGAVVLILGVAGVLLSVYIAWRAMKKDEKYSSIRNMAIAFAAYGGTSFRSAILTDTDFTSATLKSTDFRNATLTRTCFYKTKKLDRVRPGSSYLQNAQVRQVLMTSFGQDENFDRLDLRGINFKGAILIDASFQGTDLSLANLQDADLSRSKLVQAQLDGTDLTGVTLTGTYIEDWGITSSTKFDGVRCEYVYMRLPTKENPDPLRKPDNNKEVFADGEFGNFIQPIFDTLDLYHNQGVDPRAR